MKKKQRRFKGVIIVIVIVGILFGGFYIYTLDYYRVDVTDIGELEASNVRSVHDNT